MTVVQQYRQVMETVEHVAEEAGRDPSAIRVIGVSKTVGRPEVDHAYAAGVRDFGENRVQDAKQKFDPSLPDDAVLHLIGYLQTNKARDAVALFDYIHSVDRLQLIEALEHRASQAGKRPKILVQVNVAREEQKHGCRPEEAEDLVMAIAAQPHLEVVGLMTIAPLVSEPEKARPVFQGLRALRDEIQQRHPELALTELSMGMTNDYPVAIQEGATMLRIGRAIFAIG